MAKSDGVSASRSRSLLAVVLTLLLLVPAGVLFVRVWQQTDEDREEIALEQKGVEYLAALVPLISALTAAESSALLGGTSAPAAPDRLTSIDERLGEELRTTTRWTTVRDAVGRLPSTTGDPAQIFQAHVEASTLTLALARAVADNSGLSRDPDDDMSHLQRAVAIDMPETVVQVSRMGDLSQLIAVANEGSTEQKAQAQTVLLPQFGAAVSGMNENTSALTDDLQAAADRTASVTLSGSLVGALDAFRQGLEAFTRAASPIETVTGKGAPEAAMLATAQSQLQNALTNLSNVLVREMKGLLETRTDEIDNRRTEAVGLAGALIVLAMALIVVVAGVHRRTSVHRGRTASPPSDALESPPQGRPYPSLPYAAEAGRWGERSNALR